MFEVKIDPDDGEMFGIVVIFLAIVIGLCMVFAPSCQWIGRTEPMPTCPKPPAEAPCASVVFSGDAGVSR